MKERELKAGKYESLTDKRRDKRNKKKERIKQLKNKVKLMKKLEHDEDNKSEDSE